MKTTLIASLILFPIFSHAAIFGNDDRILVTPSSPNQIEAKATAIAVLSSNVLKNGDGTIDLATSTLSNMCKNERLVQGPNLDYSCTGFLVAPDLLATAGHCVYAVNNPGQILRNEKEKACKEFSWYFDYRVDASGQLKTKRIASSALYKCKEIIYAANREGAPFDDYALIRLDRPVAGRTPFKMNAGLLNQNTELKMLGFPFGTSMKLSSRGRILFNNNARHSFITTLDAFEGNSGSPVINTKNEVVGILVGGTPSANTYFDGRNQCDRQNKCNDLAQNCSAPDKDTSKFPGFQRVGSEVQKIQPIFNLVQQEL